MRGLIYFMIGFGLFCALASVAYSADERSTRMSISVDITQVQRALKRVYKDVEKKELEGRLSYVKAATVQGHLREALQALEEAQGSITSGKEE